jgi:RNA polymerase sigma-70 factor (ECF subfamily)
LVRWLGRRCDAEDILQETFWQVWRRAAEYNPGRSPPEAWLVLIARSRGADFLRQRRPEAALPAGREPETMADPCTTLARNEAAEQVRVALGQLPEEQRGALTLAFFAGLTHEQVARRQGVPVGTAKTRIRLGMKRLRYALSDGQRD